MDCSGVTLCSVDTVEYLNFFGIHILDQFAFTNVSNIAHSFHHLFNVLSGWVVVDVVHAKAYISSHTQSCYYDLE